MKTLIYIVVLLLLAGQAMAQDIPIQIHVAREDGKELNSVKLEWEFEGTKETVIKKDVIKHNESFEFLVPEATLRDHGSFLAVSVTSEQQEFEQVNWILKAKAVRNRHCRKLEVTVRPKPNQNAKLPPKAREINILDEHYIAEGRSLYLLFSSKLQALLDDLDPEGAFVDSYASSSRC